MSYTPLRISTIKPNIEINFDLFIYFKDQYLRYFEGGNIIEEEKYLKLKKQKIAKFFIDEKDELNYQNFLDNLLQSTLDSDSVSVEEKVDLVEGSCNTAIERMQENPESESSYNMAQTAAKALIQVIQKNPESLKKIFGKQVNSEEILIKHALNVSALSAKVAEVFELSEEEIDNISMAGLIHDIGLTKDDKDVAKTKELFHKYKKDLKPEDQTLYNSHVKDSLESLKDKEYVSSDILKLVENHEEVLSGDGPNKLTKLTNSEMILSMVDKYDKIIITKKLSPKEAISEMMIEELGNFELDYLQKFQKVLKAEGLLEL